MSNAITTTFNGYTLTNSELIKKTNKINKLSEQIKSNYFKIGVELIEIRDKKLYEQANEPELQTFIGFCENVLCLSRSTTYRILSTTEKVFIPLSQMQTDVLSLPDVALSKLTTLENPEEVIRFINEKEVTKETPIREIDRRLKEFNKEKKDSLVYESKEKKEEKKEEGEDNNGEIKESIEMTEKINSEMINNPSIYPSEDNGEVSSENSAGFSPKEVYNLLSDILYESDIVIVHEIVDHFMHEWYD